MTTSILTRPAARPTPATPVVHPHRDLSVLFAVIGTVAMHLLFLSTALGPDEGGFAMVARFWRAPGPYLYGPDWVDRPPGLIAVFAIADHLGPYGVRLAAGAFAAGLVVAVASAARTLAGPRAARWAAWTAAALGSSVMLSAQQLNGELVAATFVATTVAATVAALRAEPPRSLVLAALAGCAAVAAVLTKQDFLDGLAFAAVVLLAPRGASREHRRGVLRCFAAGALVPLTATVLWAHVHGGLGALWFATVGFRAEAAAVMTHWSAASRDRRAGELVVLALVSGVLVLGATQLIAAARRWRRWDAVTLGLVVAAVTELGGIIGGQNFWSHYLIALVPTLAVGAGLVVARTRIEGRLLRVAIIAAAVVAATCAPVLAYATHRHPGPAAAVSGWLRTAGRPGDTLVVPSSDAAVLDGSGMRPTYPYAWSLPVRTLDPHLQLLRRTLARPAAPTWVVQWNSSDSWGLDPAGRVDAVLRAHYREVGLICDRPLWLHDGETRALPPLPDAARCGSTSLGGIL